MLDVPLRIVLLSSQPLLAQSLIRLLGEFTNPPTVLIKIVSILDLALEFETTDLAFQPDLILLPISLAGNSFELLKTIRAIGWTGRPVLISSAQRLPPLAQLVTNGVMGLLSTQATHSCEIQKALYTALEDNSETLVQQYEQMQRLAPIPSEGPLSPVISTSASTPILIGTSNVTLPVLNERDKEMLRLMTQDLTDEQIAKRLGLSKRTVSNNLRQLFRQLKVRGRMGAVLKAIKYGVLSVPEV